MGKNNLFFFFAIVLLVFSLALFVLQIMGISYALVINIIFLGSSLIFLCLAVYNQNAKTTKIDYECSNCGFTKEKKVNPAFSVLKTLAKVFIVFLLLFSFLGITATYNQISGSIMDNPDAMVTWGGTYAFVRNFQGDFKSADFFYEISKNITSNCSDDECRAGKLYLYIQKNFQFKEGIRSDTQEIWNSKFGDCDELALLYIDMLKSININAKLNCDYNHCWTLVKLQNKTIHADITLYKWENL